MEAVSGRMRVPEQAIESGRLEKDVRIGIFDPGVEQADLAHTSPAITILADIAEYDATLGEIFSRPGHILGKRRDACPGHAVIGRKDRQAARIGPRHQGSLDLRNPGGQRLNRPQSAQGFRLSINCRCNPGFQCRIGLWG